MQFEQVLVIFCSGLIRGPGSRDVAPLVWLAGGPRMDARRWLCGPACHGSRRVQPAGFRAAALGTLLFGAFERFGLKIAFENHSTSEKP